VADVQRPICHRTQICSSLAVGLETSNLPKVPSLRVPTTALPTVEPALQCPSGIIWKCDPVPAPAPDARVTERKKKKKPPQPTGR
jgi:hypothetical protein